MPRYRIGPSVALCALIAFAPGAAGADSAPRTPRPTPSATPESVGFSSARLERLDRYLEGEVAAKRKAGVVVLLARKGKIAYFKAFGRADLASGRPLRTDDYFRWFSMTKPITSVALLTLYEQGRFQLTDPLSKYIPAFKDVKVYAGLEADGTMKLVEPVRPITIQDVFRHTAGFTYGGGYSDTPVDRAYQAAGVNLQRTATLKEFVDKLATMPLLYQPGTHYAYSYSHDVLAYLVEQLSGMRFDAYCREALFLPLGMRETAFGIGTDRERRFATLYSVGKDGALVPVRTESGADPYARAGEHPTGGSGTGGPPLDYLRFAQMLLQGGELDGVRILSPATVALMTADQLPPGTPDLQAGERHGLGVYVVTDPAQAGNLGSAGQYGRGGAGTTYFLNDPKEQLTLLLFSQRVPIDQPFIDTWQTLVYQALEH